MSKRGFAEVDADYSHPAEPSSPPPSYPSSKRQAKHSDLTFRPAHHSPSQLQSQYSQHQHHNYQSQHHQPHQQQHHHHHPQPTHAYPTGISWEQMVASLDEEIVRHILSVAAATSNYAQTLIYRHWTERMRGGWRGRKMLDALDTPSATSATTMATEMVVC